VDRKGAKTHRKKADRGCESVGKEGVRKKVLQVLQRNEIGAEVAEAVEERGMGGVGGGENMSKKHIC
jgi:hypothetical protein